MQFWLWLAPCLQPCSLNVPLLAVQICRQQRRRLQGLPPAAPPTHRHHTSCAEWGALRQAQQLLLTHRPGLQRTQQEALVAAVEEAGASVAGYLPDHTVLLVGSHDVADALAGHPDVLWLVSIQCRAAEAVWLDLRCMRGAGRSNRVAGGRAPAPAPATAPVLWRCSAWVLVQFIQRATSTVPCMLCFSVSHGFWLAHSWLLAGRRAGWLLVSPGSRCTVCAPHALCCSRSLCPFCHGCFCCVPLQGLHDEQDKLAPEWSGILEQLGAATPQLERVAALAAEQRQRQQPWSNATQAVAAAVGMLRASLPVMTRWDSRTGQLLVGAWVHFPGLVTPRQASATSAESNNTLQSLPQRARRIMLQRKQQDPGAAAAADWAPLLASRFGARLERGSADTAVVLAPAQRLAAVLEWLTHRPAVHWVAPAPRLRLANKRVTTISQVIPIEEDRWREHEYTCVGGCACMGRLAG